MKSALSVLVVVSFLVALSNAHICLLYPAQRGGYNVSVPGNMACFRPEGPCGRGIPAEQPRLTLEGGRGFTVMLQQNLNHYTPGHPGFLDVAYAVGPNPSSENFVALAQVPDFWPWLQATQTNFSIPISVPNINCPHCVLRVRYHPNKPTEPVFHNCADVTITQSSQIPTSFGALLSVVRYDRVPFGPTDVLSLLRDDGSFIGLATNIGIRSIGSEAPVGLANRMALMSELEQHYLAEGLVTVDAAKQLISFVGFRDLNSYYNNSIPSSLITFSFAQMRFLDSVPIIASPSSLASQWVGILHNPSTPNSGSDKLLIELVGPNSQSQYAFLVRGMSSGDGKVLSDVLARFPFDDTFVNYFWADFDPVMRKVYILSGDENSLFTLRVKLLVADLTTGVTQVNIVDNSRYTLTNIHVSPGHSSLFAMSPGLFNGNPDQATWTLVKVDPRTGQVAPVGSPIAPTGQYQAWYGGGVYGAGVTQVPQYGSVLVHAFKRVVDGTMELVVVRVEDGQVLGKSGIQNGVNGEMTVFDLIHLPPA